MAYYPKKIHPDSESPWNSASFGIWLKEKKNSDGVLLRTTLIVVKGKLLVKWYKIIKMHFCLAVFTIISQYKSKINGIFRITMKNCIELNTFRRKHFSMIFHEKFPPGGPQAKFWKKSAEGEYRWVFHGKMFSPKSI